MSREEQKRQPIPGERACSVSLPEPFAQRGITIISLALVLPILIALIFGAFELFLYFRAVAVVRQASLEAVRTAAAAGGTIPDETQAIDPIHAVSLSGGRTGTSTLDSFSAAGDLYLPPGHPGPHTGPNVLRLPFSLVRQSEDINASDTLPGVQYLPLVSTVLCDSPLNEQASVFSSCPQELRRLVSYLLPAKLDFDGDGREDPAFFHPLSSEEDWWVLPSSTGTLFRAALRVKVGDGTRDSAGRPALPCPADYDGDGRTDFCTVVPSEGRAALRVRFSSERYSPLRSYVLRFAGSYALPIPGRYGSGPADSFALLVVESADSADRASTVVWGPFGTNEAFAGPAESRVYNERSTKPRGGSLFRPAPADVDGDGIVDSAFLEWPGGNAARPYAGRGSDGTFAPWSLFVPEGAESPGVYVIERLRHQITLLTRQAASTSGDMMLAVPIAGRSDSAAPAEPLAAPDPLARTRFSARMTPLAPGEPSCPGCYAGGDYSGDGGNAADARLNTPSALAGASKGPLFVADYGNLRIRKIEPGSDGIVNGKGDERISTVAGGAVRPAAACPDLTDGAAEGPAPGARAVDWDSYSLSARVAGIHPSCVAVRPVSLAYDDEASLLFIGDEFGGVFLLTPGKDGRIDGSADETLQLYLGPYRPAKTAGALSQPLKLDLAATEKGRSLIVLLRTLSEQDEPGKFQLLKLVPAPAEGGFLHNSKPAPFVTESLLTSDDLQGDAQGLAAVDFVYIADKPARIFISDFWRGSQRRHFIFSFTENQAKSGAPRFVPDPFFNTHLAGSGISDPAKTDPSLDELRRPLSTAPIVAGPGIALNRSKAEFFAAEPSRERIWSVLLDQDGDGLADLAQADRTADADRDGDGLDNSTDPMPGTPAAPRAGDGQARYLDTSVDPLFVAVGASRRITTPSGAVDRLEWWIDALSSLEPRDSSLHHTRVDPGLLLRSSTIGAFLPQGALHGDRAWPAGPSRATEYNTLTGLPLLTPVLLASRAPNADGIKDAGTYDQCRDFSLDEDASRRTIRGADQSPISVCGRDVGKPLYRDGRTVGVRRAELTWVKADFPADIGGITFLDFDGREGRNPAFTLSADFPTALWIANLSTQAACPGAASISELRALRSALETLVPGMPTGLEQYACPLPRRFFTSSELPSAQLLADVHAEWSTRTFFKGEPRPLPITADRTSAARETAYRVLESSLKISRAAQARSAGDASVAVSLEPQGEVRVEVSYVWPLSRFLARFKGAPTVTIHETVARKNTSEGR